MATQHETDVLVSAWPDHQRIHGTAVTYTPDGGQAVAITAVGLEESNVRFEDDQGRETHKILDMQVSATDIGQAPAIDDAVTYNSVDYFVTQVPDSPAEIVMIRCIHRDKIETGSNIQYRRT
jgi:hypothetical protein